jgi:hypothetical protein
LVKHFDHRPLAERVAEARDLHGPCGERCRSDGHRFDERFGRCEWCGLSKLTIEHRSKIHARAS